MIPVEQVEVIDDFTSFGIHAFTTTRKAGSFGTGGDEPVRDVMGRWSALRATLAASNVRRLATAIQIHGANVLIHGPGWAGWLRAPDADGHLSLQRGTAMAVTVADCVPVFIAHPSGAACVLHSGWRGTAARIIERGIATMEQQGCDAGELRMHLGPAICGRCYEVSSDVIRQLTGESVDGPRTVDLRALIAAHARARGVARVTTSPRCTRCDNDRFFSHRAGDPDRQIGVIYAAG